jgi:hypothetical protein
MRSAANGAALPHMSLEMGINPWKSLLEEHVAELSGRYDRT